MIQFPCLVNGPTVVQSLSCVQLFATPWTSRLPCPSPSPRARSNSYPLSRWCHPTISSPVVPFSYFNLSQHQVFSQWVSSSQQVAKVWEFQSISVLPMNILDWFRSTLDRCNTKGSAEVGIWMVFPKPLVLSLCGPVCNQRRAELKKQELADHGSTHLLEL